MEISIISKSIFGILDYGLKIKLSGLMKYITKSSLKYSKLNQYDKTSPNLILM